MAKELWDFTGFETGWLTVIEKVGRNPNGEWMWLCHCKCGNKEHLLCHQALVTTYKRPPKKIRNCGCIGRTGNDLTGQRYGRLVALECCGTRTKRQNTIWLWQCDCGVQKEIESRAVVKGHTMSCGCLFQENLIKLAERATTHGLSDHRLYKIHHGMKQRCYNKNTKSYPRYGARGIVMEEPWLSNATSFIDWALKEGWKRGLHIDRIDNDGPYAPWNCRVVSCKVNANNTSRNKREMVFGREMTVSEAEDFYGIQNNKLYNKVWKPGVTIENALISVFDKEVRRNIEDFLDMDTLLWSPRKVPNPWNVAHV